MIFFSSDLHFGHANICEYAGRPFNSVEHMNNVLIANWNSVVSPEDTVYCLGDMCMGKIAESLPLLGQLNGNKRLLLGNHDRPFPKNKKSAEGFTLYDPYFEDIRLTDYMDIAGRSVLLSHFPAAGDSHESDRFLDFRPEYDGWIMHGHVHSPEIQIAYKHVHVGIDADWESYGVERYHPIPFSAVERMIEHNGTI